MTVENETNKKPVAFWKSRKGILVQIIIVLFPSAVVLKSGNWLLAGLSCSLLLAWAGLRLQKLTWKDVGFKKPVQYKNEIVTALISTFALIVLSFILRHLVTYLTGKPPGLEAFKKINGNWHLLGVGLLVAWIFGAFIEEMFFRGFLINAFYKIFPAGYPDERTRWGISLCITSLLTGFGHAYQGITGMILAAVIGFCLGLIYLKRNHTLFPCILTHGFYDSIAFIMLFAGFNLDQLIK